MLSQADTDALASLADGLGALDRACYARHGRDPRQPLLGLGPPDAPLCFVGRDPGEQEVRQGEPFVGESGQKIRRVLAAHAGLPPPYSPEDGLAAGRGFFWINTVPYKPAGNKPWPLAVRKRFHALLFPLLAERWRGRDVITLGREAFDWFGLNQPDPVRRALDAFWALEDKFEQSLELQLEVRGRRRDFVLHPLPHPSPANARWTKLFPALLERRLERLVGGQRVAHPPDARFG